MISNFLQEFTLMSRNLSVPFPRPRNWAIQTDMEANIKKRHGLLLLALFTAAGLALSPVSLAGSASFSSGQRVGNSNGGFFRSEPRLSRPAHSTRSSPKRLKFVVVEDRLEQPASVSVQQTIVVSPAEPKRSSTNKIYVPPRWVETEGVLVLEPGHWAELEPGAEY